MNSELRYIGRELDIFAAATNWKRYFKRKLSPFVKGDVLEVGAGIGSTTRVLCDSHKGRWTCLEPDPDLAAELAVSAGESACNIEVLRGTIADLAPDRVYHSILYIDVLEHIERDIEELECANTHLAVNGHLVVLVPAHQWLFTDFDAAIGHYRRYNREGLKLVAPKSLRPVGLFYLDSAGLLASLANSLLLHRSMPTKKQIVFWDRFLVPLSRVLDPLFGFHIGKTCVGVWHKSE